MRDNPLDDFEDDAVMGILDQAVGLEALLQDGNFKNVVLPRIAEMVEQTIYNFVHKVDPTDVAAVIRCQEVLRLFRYKLLADMGVTKSNAEIMFREAIERGLIDEDEKIS